jgi:hypothetical protein
MLRGKKKAGHSLVSQIPRRMTLYADLASGAPVQYSIGLSNISFTGRVLDVTSNFRGICPYHLEVEVVLAGDPAKHEEWRHWRLKPHPLIHQRLEPSPIPPSRPAVHWHLVLILLLPHPLLHHLHSLHCSKS